MLKKMNLFSVTVMMAEGEGRLQTGARPCWGAEGRGGSALAVCWEILNLKFEMFAIMPATSKT